MQIERSSTVDLSKLPPEVGHEVYKDFSLMDWVHVSSVCRDWKTYTLEVLKIIYKEPPLPNLSFSQLLKRMKAQPNLSIGKHIHITALEILHRKSAFYAFLTDRNLFFMKDQYKGIGAYNALTGQIDYPFDAFCVDEYLKVDTKDTAHPKDAWCFSPDHQWIVAPSSNQCCINLWNVSTGQCIRSLIRKDLNHSEYLCRRKDKLVSPPVCFAADSQRFLISTHIATGKESHQVVVWHIDKEEPLYILPQNTPKGAYIVAMHLSPDNTQVLVASHDWKILLWDFNTGALIEELHTKEITRNAKFSPDGEWIAANDYESIHLWKAKPDPDGNRECKLLRYLPHSEKFRGCLSEYIGFSPDSSKILMLSRYRQTGASLWDIASGACLCQWKYTIPCEKDAFYKKEGAQIVFAGFKATLRDAQFSPNGQYVMFISDAPLGFHGPQGKRSTVTVHAVPQDLSPPLPLDLPPVFGTEAALIHRDYATTFYCDHYSGSVKHETRGSIRAAFSADSSKLVITSETRGSIEIWDVGTGQLIKEIQYNDDVSLPANRFERPDKLRDTRTVNLSFEDDDTKIVVVTPAKTYILNFIEQAVQEGVSGTGLPTDDKVKEAIREHIQTAYRRMREKSPPSLRRAARLALPVAPPAAPQNSWNCLIS